MPLHSQLSRFQFMKIGHLEFASHCNLLLHDGLQASTPEGLRQMLATLMPFENVPIEEAKPYVEQW